MRDEELSLASRTERDAIVLIAVGVTGAALYWLRGILTPFALAFFLLIMIDGLERIIDEKIPSLKDGVSLWIAIGAILIAFGVSVYVVATNVASFASELSGYAPRVN